MSRLSVDPRALVQRGRLSHCQFITLHNNSFRCQVQLSIIKQRLLETRLTMWHALHWHIYFILCLCVCVCVALNNRCKSVPLQIPSHLYSSHLGATELLRDFTFDLLSQWLCSIYSCSLSREGNCPSPSLLTHPSISAFFSPPCLHTHTRTHCYVARHAASHRNKKQITCMCH